MRTIRQQLTRKLLLGFSLLLGVGGVAVYLCTRAALVDEFDRTLRAKANAITSATEQHGTRIKVELAERFLLEYHEGIAVNFFQVRRADGTTVRRSESLGRADLPVRPGTSSRPRFWDLKLPTGYRGRAVGFTFRPQLSRQSASVQPAELTLVVAGALGELDETLAALAVVLLGCGLLLLAATGLIVPRVLRRELAPLNQLAEQAGRIHADSLSTRFPTNALPGELAPISSRLNDLLSRLEESFERERRFSANLAHELRTPIAELRSLADLALKWPESRPAEIDQDTFAIAVQMEGIVTRLLALLRSERGQLVPERQSVLLASAVADTWHPFAERAAQKALPVTQNVSPKAAIESDPVLLRSILTNLFDNAVEYTGRSGTITIEGGVNGDRFTLRVANSVDRIDASDLSRFFERFWRKDTARSASQHSGLGLSLARAFAQALGCELTAALEGQSRLLLTLSGPAHSAILSEPQEPGPPRTSYGAPESAIRARSGG